MIVLEPVAAQSALIELQELASLSENEEQLKIGCEDVLKGICRSNGVIWNPYSYEHSLRSGTRRVDAVHGSTVIEYEFPGSFKQSHNHRIKHARAQAEEYAALLSSEEGRAVSQYSLVVWDGATISFGRWDDNGFSWDDPHNFDNEDLVRLVNLISEGGMPLVSPMVLNRFVGPSTAMGRQLLPLLFDALVEADNSKTPIRTKLIYTEWARLFGQVDGQQTERLALHLQEISHLHDTDYGSNPQAYVFALSTYIAIIAKVCAAFAIAGETLAEMNAGLTPARFLIELENDEYFEVSGIRNMLSSDFFSWYLGEDVRERFEPALGTLLGILCAISFDMTIKSAESVRDLFKGLYMEFVPAPLRHALGEYYTPDWLAAHVMDASGWQPSDSMLDPTCGSGTFLLEALRRRLLVADESATAQELLRGLYGFDLNPLAVLTTRASIVVFLSGRFSFSENVVLPIYLADAINTADPVEGIFSHTIMTEKGERTFDIPVSIARSERFLDAMELTRAMIDSDQTEEKIWDALLSLSPDFNALSTKHRALMYSTLANLVALHKEHWNGIWCSILFDRIAAGCVENVDVVIGNPPWVKWSHLPRAYAEFIKPLCERLAIFSEDTWVGGIQSDISTVITYHALERFVRPGGSLAFLITGTVFKNESSQGFRRWTLVSDDACEPFEVELVEDYTELHPFEGAANAPALLLIRRNGQPTRYPIDYIVYGNRSPKEKGSIWKHASKRPLVATPVPGTLDGPWMVGEPQRLATYEPFFNVASESCYQARKGITTDANGIFFVDASDANKNGLIKISNNPANGRRRNVARKTSVIETHNVFPLLRGRDVNRFNARIPLGQAVIVPQRSMHGDPDLATKSPKTFKFLASYRNVLESRSSYRRFQQGHPFWSIWSCGEYSFAPYKVVWKEMSGKRFAAAYVGTAAMPDGSTKVVIPDHKVYFIPVESEDEAAYLTGYLNARTVANAISSYAATLSLGASVPDYLAIPKFNPCDDNMRNLADLSKRLSSGVRPSADDEKLLDDLASTICQNATSGHTN